MIKKALTLIGWCCLCWCSGETVDHVLLYCKFTYALWGEVFIMFGVQWVMPFLSGVGFGVLLLVLLYLSFILLLALMVD